MTIFSKIIAGEIPAHKVAETGEYLAFMDINPLVEGHVLVIPKKEEDYIFDLDDATLAGLILFSKKVAAAIVQAVPCKRIGITVIGLEVPHAHVHLIPLNHMDDMDFGKKKLDPNPDELANLAKKIKGFI